jgi:uncharacterized protein YdeI (YjbR/CyaY-like superfamily)
VSYDEAVEVALCYGWIDGQSKSYDESSWLQKFTPRRTKSIWSKINREKVERLIKNGQMKPAGLQAIESAKQDGRWDAAYDLTVLPPLPSDFQAELDKNPAAQAFFATLNSQNRYAILFRIQTAKKAETRAKRIEQLIRMLEIRKSCIHNSPVKIGTEKQKAAIFVSLWFSVRPRASAFLFTDLILEPIKALIMRAGRFCSFFPLRLLCRSLGSSCGQRGADLRFPTYRLKYIHHRTAGAGRYGDFGHDFGRLGRRRGLLCLRFGCSHQLRLARRLDSGGRGEGGGCLRGRRGHTRTIQRWRTVGVGERRIGPVIILLLQLLNPQNSH